MTVLEKIKRCVSLVWDFQEIYGEEDIEDFCSNELRTYPQHDEIMEYFKHIETLEKENADLERRIERAKECMKKLLFIINSDPANYNCKGLVQDAEDFIYNRTCNIRKSGNHCITNEPCIMCDK